MKRIATTFLVIASLVIAIKLSSAIAYNAPRNVDARKRSAAMAEIRRWAEPVTDEGWDTPEARQRHLTRDALTIWDGIPRDLQQQALRGRRVDFPVIKLPPVAREYA